MDSAEFRMRGNDMINYITNYLDTIGERRVTPDVEPGFLRPLLPSEAPVQPDSFDDIMDDIENKIMTGMTHWQHPRFHAYFSSGNSYPSILGDMLADAIGAIGFSWAASPSCTELETLVLDWFGKMLGLPSQFLADGEGSQGGGVIQTSASECILDALLAARSLAIEKLRSLHGEPVEDGVLLSKLVAYCSKEAHSCVEKAAKIGFVKIRLLEPDSNSQLTGKILQEAMDEDIKHGLHPFFVSAILGSTGICAFDNVSEMGPVCEAMGVWLHVDGAYAGNSFVCPEKRSVMRGIEYASSFNVNPNKWLLTSFDCSCMWVRDQHKFTQGMIVNPLYLKHDHQEKAIDYRHWGIPLSRRFRALKLWFVFRSYGVSGLQAHIRNHCQLAKLFESFVKQDDRFVVVNKVQTGLVCFKLVGSNALNEKLLALINDSGRFHMVPSITKGQFIIRMAVCAEKACEQDMIDVWEGIQQMANLLLQDDKINKKNEYFENMITDNPLRMEKIH